MQRVWKRTGGFVLVALLLAAWPAAAAQRGRRTISGGVNFTNDTPPVKRYVFKLHTRDMRRVLAVRKTRNESGFTFRNLRPGRYVVTVTGPHICNLWYEVDVRRESVTDLTMLGDADCGSHSLPPGWREEE